MKTVTRIDSVFVPVTDLQKSEQWYLSVFPFQVVFRSSDELYVGFRFKDNGETKTALTLHKVDHVPKRDHIPFNFYTEDVDGLYTYLKDKGVKVGDIHGGEGMRFFEIHDPDGNVLEAVNF